MGIAFTIGTPEKVAHFGIDSVMTIGDDKLIEKLRKVYCTKYHLVYDEITKNMEDFRARRITAYLNLINDIVKKKFDEFKNSPWNHRDEIMKYIDMLPGHKKKPKDFRRLKSAQFDSKKLRKWIESNLSIGSIDVNIMTKLDKENYVKGEKLPVEHNDAHVALRGYAKSNLKSSIVLSAGLNPRLFSYMEQFEDFYPDFTGKIKKKIVLKVSDYRSALVQGKFLAKRGLWVSEYRIESGLNCGGHAFATEGHLLGPILSEFKEKRLDLLNSVYDILKPALLNKECLIPRDSLPFKFTAQGGVGTTEEHQFLINHYDLDSVGWGTPFLLVPEATFVDDKTLDKLLDATEANLYLSNISPLGIPFNSLRGSTKEIEKLARIAKGRPGSPCIEGHLEVFNTEFTQRPICTASRQYQNLKIKQLDGEEVSPEIYQDRFENIVSKSCLCTGLVNPALLVNNLSTKAGGDGVEICPGPNLAYFSKIMSLRELTDHIYGRTNVISRTDRPQMFIKELNIYLGYLMTKIEEIKEPVTKRQMKYFASFSNNLKDGIRYYKSLFKTLKLSFGFKKIQLLRQLNNGNEVLRQLEKEILSLGVPLPS